MPQVPATIEVTHGLTPVQIDALWPAIDRSAMRPLFAADGFPDRVETFREMCRGDVLAASVDGRLAGALWLTEQRRHPLTDEPVSCSVRLWFLDPAYRGRLGLMLGRITVSAVLTVLGYGNLFATVHPKHRACQRYLAQVGFTRLGVLPRAGRFGGSATDLWIYSWYSPEGNMR